MQHWLHTKTLVLVPLAVALSCGGPSKPKINRVADPAALISRGRSFTGDDGVKIEVAELSGGKNALVKVTGIRSEQEGKVFEHRIEENGPRLNYITQIDGRDQYTLVRETSRSGGDASWRLYIRDGGFRGMDIRYDEDASKTVDTVALYRTFEEQRDTGVLEAIQRFDRKDEEKQEVDELEKERAAAAEACQAKVEFAVNWSSIDDDTLKEYSISGYCEHVLDAMRTHCEHAPARAYVAENIKRVTCSFGAETGLRVANGEAAWTVDREGVNLADFARKAMAELEVGEGSTLGREIAIARTQVCADEERAHYIVMGPSNSELEGMHYGDGETFFQVRTPQTMPDWFFEPRFYNERNNDAFRGLNLRVFSHVDYDEDENTCSLTCGSRETQLQVLEPAEVADLVRGMKVEPHPAPRLPHALARDRRGIYYLVDRSTEPGRERDFKLYVGRMGNLQPQAMKNVVSDSEGEIFSSKAGDLRFVFDREEALWITGRRRLALRKVPIEDNWQMIYNRLGVYFGNKLGTPCDDLAAE
ncbi:hypothetical protein [Haliangium sp.]|uniref:hypothetical protein n=1 Tax=Haliangium sp. TaxID=2663208 RepID=UPI003D0B4FE6